MESLKYSLFDLFSFAIPGGIFLLSLFVLGCGPAICENWITTIKTLFDDVNVYYGLAFILVAYFAGIAISLPARWLLRLKEWKWPVHKSSSISRSELYTLVRAGNKENFHYIERWNVLTKMMSSFSLVVLFDSIFFCYQIRCFTWPYMLTGCALSVAFILQASEYHRWSMADLENAAKNLEARREVSEV